jgi:hypothetical protein
MPLHADPTIDALPDPLAAATPTPSANATCETSAAAPEDDAKTSETNVVRMMPLHALPATRARRSPGRPKKIKPRPDADEARYRRDLQRDLQRHQERDALGQAILQREGSAAVLRALVLAVAREAASLDYDLRFTLGDQRAIERARSRRCDALATTAKLVLEQRRAELETGDVPAHKLLQIVNLLVEEIDRVAVETLGGDVVRAVMEKWRPRIEDITSPIAVARPG